MSRILVLCDDLLFWARIRAAAQVLGRELVRITDEASMEAAFEEGDVDRVLVNLDSRSIDPLPWAARWKARPDPPDLVAFGSHVDEAILARAREAGFDRVVPNGVLHARVAEFVA